MYCVPIACTVHHGMSGVQGRNVPPYDGEVTQIGAVSRHFDAASITWHLALKSADRLRLGET